jgi:GH25 family lysozyme M1 (1,4-beta-N-acetylmuramidase)
MAKKILSKGIDISYANGKIDWSIMKNNVDWVIFRVGYGSDYASQDDAQFKNNIEGCEKYGIPYGVYLYSYADTAEKAKSEAEHCIRLLKGHHPTMPVFYDMEEEKIRVLGKDRILQHAKIFCRYITEAGYLYGTYCNTDWFTNYLTDKWYDSYPKWLAQYNNVVTYKGTYDIWQYSCKGKMPGHSGDFDMNYCYTSFLKGDVNLDGKITAADARMALQASAKMKKLNNIQKWNADMNKDGKLTASDAKAILEIAAKIKK